MSDRSKNQPVLVTGAGGFIAFHLISHLLRAGQSVVGVDNLDPYYEPELKRRNLQELAEVSKASGRNFQFVQEDFRDLSKSSLNRLEFSKVIHLGAKAGVRPSLDAPFEYNDVNIRGTLEVLEFCRRKGISQFVFASSSSVYGNSTKPPFKENSGTENPISIYGATKRAGEILVSTYSHLFGLRAAVLRFFTVYGPRQRPDLAIHKFCLKVLENKPIELFAAVGGGRDYTHVSDIVDGIRGSMTWLESAPTGTCEAFNLGSGRIITIDEVVKQIERGLGRKANVVRSPAISGDVEVTFADLQKSRSLLGYSPKISFEAGMQDFIRWATSQHGKKTMAA